MTTVLLWLGAGVAASALMRIIIWLDSPEKTEGKRMVKLSFERKDDSTEIISVHGSGQDIVQALAGILIGFEQGHGISASELCAILPQIVELKKSLIAGTELIDLDKIEKETEDAHE